MERKHLAILDGNSHFQLVPSEMRRIPLAAEYAKCKNRHYDFTGRVQLARSKSESSGRIPQLEYLR
jgi:hypothetical protein